MFEPKSHFVITFHKPSIYSNLALGQAKNFGATGRSVMVSLFVPGIPEKILPAIFLSGWHLPNASAFPGNPKAR